MKHGSNLLPKAFGGDPPGQPLHVILQGEWQISVALDHARARFHREGPFVFAEDDPHGEVLRAAGMRVTYVDEGSIFIEEPA